MTAFSEKDFRELVRNLNRREINFPEVWRKFANLGVKDSYERLFALIDSPDLEKWQVVNILSVVLELLRLFRDKQGNPIGDPDKLFETLLRLSTDKRPLVRSVAISFAIHVVITPFFQERVQFKAATLERVTPVAREAREMGLTNPHAAFVEDFLREK